MSEGRKTNKVGIGEKGEAPAGAEIVELVKPDEDEVGGRCIRMTNVVCPFCYSVCRIIEDTEYRKWFQCWNCFGNFQY